MASSRKAFGHSVWHDAYEHLFTWCLLLSVWLPPQSCVLCASGRMCGNAGSRYREPGAGSGRSWGAEGHWQDGPGKVWWDQQEKCSSSKTWKVICQKEQQTWGNQPERCLKAEVWVRQVRLAGWHRRWRGQEEKLNRHEGREGKSKGTSRGSPWLWAEGEESVRTTEWKRASC